jgi:L-ascorbate metabolism protein UlaG (beta-lactamase superfamily)
MKYFLLVLFLLPFSLVFAQPEVFQTKKANLEITPVFHAALIMQWNGVTVYADPYGGVERYKNQKAPDVVLITHEHGDHLDETTLNGLDLTKTELIAPQKVIDQLKNKTFAKITVLGNGQNLTIKNIKIEAVGMYNLPEETARHKKGAGNGYVVNFGGKRVYLSGDTDGTPDMRALKNIDVAFVCMNPPYTMDVAPAADAVLAFKPAVVYPYHYRQPGDKLSDIEMFKKLVNDKDAKIDVRLRNWYTRVQPAQ